MQMITASIQSLEDLHRYSEALARRSVDDDPVVRRLHSAKQIVWLFLLTLSFLFYYLIDKMQEALGILI
jgi:hypothetical protein